MATFRITWRKLRTLSLPIVWLVVAFWMIQVYLGDPPLAEGDERGANVEGVLTLGLLGSAIELVTLMLLVRPWSETASPGGLILAWGIFLPWTFISAMMSLHGGSVLMVHLVWMMALLFSLALFSTAALRAKPKPKG